jgi:hypothetical protein
MLVDTVLVQVKITADGTKLGEEADQVLQRAAEATDHAITTSISRCRTVWCS